MFSGGWTPGISPVKTTCFFNSVAFGVVAPVLYYMIALPFAKWIALLFVVRLLGGEVGKTIDARLVRRFGEQQSAAFLQTLNVISYLMLAAVGWNRPGQNLGFFIIYLSQFLGGICSGSFPSIWPLIANPGDKRDLLLAQSGFALGCIVTAAMANHHPVPDSILITGGFLIPSLMAGGISMALVIYILQTHWSNETSSPQTMHLDSGSAVLGVQPAIIFIIMLSCDGAFSMIACILPLTDREICAFSPALLAIYFAVLMLTSGWVARWSVGRPIAHLYTLPWGLLVSAIGFSGFATALWLSWKFQDTFGSRIAFWLMWLAGVPAAVGHGLLHVALPCTKSIAASALVVLTETAAVIFVARIWAPHERASLAIPAALLIAALPVAIALALLQRKTIWALDQV